ncbi:translation initiation factor IF-2 N-terminal domain-containing protein [Smaragdicoccus niigatensis]|uniref:translation initiation factor IF-2 N-terminal domain-containing protein n=1 Tax=Smaragdicoccus niigatensis TaxID=359359 RepID=UPI00036B40B2|nr:translation initiation factor IF-2 N-terminal domain-containing protein [Smaragdicoccus niigatensis]
MDKPATEDPVLGSDVSQPIELPERIRVHALAKLLGVTSKKLLGRLGELGADAKSAQSSVDRAVAVNAAESFGVPVGDGAPAPAESPAPAAEPAATETPVYQTLFTSPVAETAPVVIEAPAEVGVPVFMSPDKESTPPPRPPRKRAAPKAAQKVEVVTETVVETAAEASTAEAPTTEAPEGDEQASDEGAGGENQQGPGGANRRRRRGRRGRGRGRGGENAADGENGSDEGESDEAESAEAPAIDDAETAEGEAADSSESADGADDGGDDSDETNPNRRRRRRRRRKGTGEGGAEEATTEDDPPNTVVHEREPRNNEPRNKQRARDEVQGISGSTRLEAKRQRRRDGREAGRRRPPILSEAEFLARREAVDRVMVVREKAFPGHPATTQVAVLEDKILVEHFITNTSTASMVGNVYLGKVQNVLPSMEAAFVDIGKGRNGVLYAGEVNWEAAGLGGRERKIEQALKPGDKVLVQVSKDPVGHKGARLTTQISFAGRFLVYVPGGSSTGISRKLPDTERKRLKEILRDVLPDDAGVIIRTASEGVSAEELAGDVARLQEQWRKIEEQVEAASDNQLPATLYEEPDLLVKVIRDLFNEDFSKLVIEGDKSWKTIETYVSKVAPDLMPRLERYEATSNVDVFNAHRIDEQLNKALDRKVWLPSGGTLVIDRTEAMTVVDVNTGKFTGTGGNLEETVTRNNIEAAEEIVRQMRLRDIGGIIIVDFIDMVLESNRDLVLRRLTECLARDRTRHQVSEVTSLGLVQMTRKKLGTGLVEAFSTTCEHCHGRGIVVSDIPVEVAGAESKGDREQQPRRKRSRDRAPQTETVTEHGLDVDPSVKRAHPVALAMAAHHHEHDGEHPEETSVAEVGAPVEPEAVVVDEPAVEVRPEPEATPEPVVEAETAPVVEPEPAAADEAPTAPRARTRRRVQRVTASPESTEVGEGFTFSAPAGEPVAAQSVAVVVPQIAAPPRERPRRRTAGRPAGPPQD